MTSSNETVADAALTNSFASAADNELKDLNRPAVIKSTAFGQRAGASEPITGSITRSSIAPTPTPVAAARPTPAAVSTSPLKSEMISSGTYAGMQKADAIMSQVEKNRSSVKAQRQNMIIASEKKVESLDQIIESNDASFQVEVDAAKAKYDEMLAQTNAEIARAEDYLRSLQLRKTDERNEYNQENLRIEDLYQDRNTDLRLMLAAEKSSLEILRGMEKKAAEAGTLTASPSALKQETAPASQSDANRVTRSTPSA